jgi:hypothetical protein
MHVPARICIDDCRRGANKLNGTAPVTCDAMASGLRDFLARLSWPKHTGTLQQLGEGDDEFSSETLSWYLNSRCKLQSTGYATGATVLRS